MAVQLFNITTKNIDIFPRRFERKHYLASKCIGLDYGLLRHICLPAGENPPSRSTAFTWTRLTWTNTKDQIPIISIKIKSAYGGMVKTRG
jgi:hypothetical protein